MKTSPTSKESSASSLTNAEIVDVLTESPTSTIFVMFRQGVYLQVVRSTFIDALRHSYGRDKSWFEIEERSFAGETSPIYLRPTP